MARRGSTYGQLKRFPEIIGDPLDMLTAPLDDARA
jgi:hypothetical protein